MPFATPTTSPTPMETQTLSMETQTLSMETQTSAMNRKTLPMNRQTSATGIRTRPSGMEIMPIAEPKFTKKQPLMTPSLRFPLKSGGTLSRRASRFPSRSGGNLQEGGNCKLCPCSWYNSPRVASSGRGGRGRLWIKAFLLYPINRVCQAQPQVVRKEGGF